MKKWCLEVGRLFVEKSLILSEQELEDKEAQIERHVRKCKECRVFLKKFNTQKRKNMLKPILTKLDNVITLLREAKKLGQATEVEAESFVFASPFSFGKKEASSTLTSALQLVAEALDDPKISQEYRDEMMEELLSFVERLKDKIRADIS